MYIVDPVLQTLGLGLPLLFANITLWIGLCPLSPVNGSFMINLKFCRQV